MSSPAMERAGVLFFHTAGKDVPVLAREYVSILAKQLGGCGEVYLTAFAHYAQAVEGLKCTEEDYLLEGHEHYYNELGLAQRRK